MNSGGLPLVASPGAKEQFLLMEADGLSLDIGLVSKGRAGAEPRILLGAGHKDSRKGKTSAGGCGLELTLVGYSVFDEITGPQ